MIQCVACSMFSLREAGKMAVLGFGACGKSRDKHHYKSATYQRECKAFDQVANETEQSRREWMAKK